MLDIFDPFDGINKFKKFCETLDTPIEHKPIVRYEGIPEANKLYDIYKRTTNLSVNKCVGIGFAYDDAQRFITKRLKLQVDNKTDVVTFYDIVPQGNEAAKDPLWNDGKIMIGKYES